MASLATHRVSLAAHHTDLQLRELDMRGATASNVRPGSALRIARHRTAALKGHEPRKN
jgi:hypothetical protein